MMRFVQTGDAGLSGKIRVKVHWESTVFSGSPSDLPRFFLRDILGPDDKVRAVVPCVVSDIL